MAIVELCKCGNVDPDPVGSQLLVSGIVSGNNYSGFFVNKI
jgi:hypothetical protein